MKLKPSNFNTKPWNCVFKQAEHEWVAQNIMVILGRTGNTWRELSWEEYVKEREIDGQFSDRERDYFDLVIGYCKSPNTAKTFSQFWKEVYDN